ncbi:Hypothetical Protein FCC1311_100382 [Hondaea fermentalgiana]|uniref:Uncharacterized protein n=1 Tax=Hondaea fermentalgiana TaxID=2315210 RepID=A0A2R5GTA7_9STRA|nr:Hypothetical Protein FCC1311_100382 [Hondaea fermentalgiana]|eukprot:GBG33815.1 Hypothetical Protein FCC1311_100382 [Hondaea fermentalgiana]
MLVSNVSHVDAMDIVAKQQMLVMKLAKIIIAMISIELAITTVSTSQTLNRAIGEDDDGLKGMALLYNGLLHGIVLFIPMCAIIGVRKQNTALLCTSCIFSSLCVIFSVVNIFTLVFYLLGMDILFASLPGIAGDSGVLAVEVIMLLYTLFFCFVWAYSALASYKLQNSMGIAVVVHSPQDKFAPVGTQVSTKIEYVQRAPV